MCIVDYYVRIVLFYLCVVIFNVCILVFYVCTVVVKPVLEPRKLANKNKIHSPLLQHGFLKADVSKFANGFDPIFQTPLPCNSGSLLLDYIIAPFTATVLILWYTAP